MAKLLADVLLVGGGCPCRYMAQRFCARYSSIGLLCDARVLSIFRCSEIQAQVIARRLLDDS